MDRVMKVLDIFIGFERVEGFLALITSF